MVVVAGGLVVDLAGFLLTYGFLVVLHFLDILNNGLQ